MYNDNNNDIDDYYSVPLADEDVYPFASSLSFKYKKKYFFYQIFVFYLEMVVQIWTGSIDSSATVLKFTKLGDKNEILT